MDNIDVITIGNINNLCITRRHLNCSKYIKDDKYFENELKNKININEKTI